METPNRFLKVPEVAYLLRVPRTRAYEMIARKELPGVIYLSPRTIRVDSSVLIPWLEARALDFGTPPRDA